MVLSVANSQLKKELQKTSDFQQNKIELKSKFSFDVELIFSPTKSNQIRYLYPFCINESECHRSQYIFFKNFEWESGVSLGELDPIKPQQSNRSCKQSDHDCTKAQIIKQIKCY